MPRRDAWPESQYPWGPQASTMLFRRYFRGGDTAAAIESSRPIVGIHIADLHGFAAARRMHEAVVADVNPDVRICSFQRVKKNQVAGLQCGSADRCAAFAHRSGGARKRHADRVLENMRHVAAAIPTRFWIGSAIAIFDIKEGERVKNQFFGAIGGCAVRRIRQFARINVAGNLLRPRAGCQQRQRNEQHAQ